MPALAAIVSLVACSGTGAPVRAPDAGAGGTGGSGTGGAAAPQDATTADASPASAPPRTLPVAGEVEYTSTPVVMKQNGVYYMFSMGPGMTIKSSTDMIDWKWRGMVFKTDPAWFAQVIPGYGIWAPDISYFAGKYHIYYALSVVDSQHSALGQATNVTLDLADPNYRWVDQGMVLESNTGDKYNAIDPNIVVDQAGLPWLAWGSYWDGVMLRRVDPATGRFLASDTTTYSLSAGPVEAPFIVFKNGFYYLFYSVGQFYNPDGYHVMVGRSPQLTGPYVDSAGVALKEGGGTVVSQPMGNISAPGHNSVLLDGATDYFITECIHKDDPTNARWMFISTIQWDGQGWPRITLTP